MELKDILSFTGIEADNIDDFKTKFQESFVNKANAHSDPDIRKKITKTVFVGQQNVFKKFFAENGIDTEAEEFTKAEKLEDYIRTGIGKLSEAKQAELEDLKSKVGATNDEVIKQKESIIEQLKRKATDYETNWKKTAAELETERANFNSKIRENSIQSAIAEARKQIKTKAKLTDVEQLGLDAALKTRLKFDLDDTGNPYVTNEKGERIPSKTKASEFQSLAEAMQTVVDSLNLNEVNPHGGKPAPVTPQAQQRPAPINVNPNHNINAPRPHPNAVKAAGG